MHARWDRRSFCLEGLASLAAGLSLGAGAGSPTPTAKLRGALWWVHSDASKAGEDYWKAELAAQKEIGFDLLWLCSTTHVLRAIRENLCEDPYPILFKEAERLGMRVILETHTSSLWWKDVDWKKEIGENERLIPEVLERYSGYRSFWGWYIGYETHHAVGEYGREYQALLAAVRKRCAKESPGKPVMISPFFLLDTQGVLGFEWIPPAEFTRFWAETLNKAEVDILALQDSGEHLACYTLGERRPFLEAGRKACDQAGAVFWGNVETAELDVVSVEAYKEIRPQVDLGGKGEYWGRVPLEKLKGKMALASEFAEDLVTWGYTEFWRPSLGGRAKAYYEAYRGILR